MTHRLKQALLSGGFVLFLMAPAWAQQGMMQQGDDHMTPMGKMPMSQQHMHHESEEYGHHHGNGPYGGHSGGAMPMMDHPGMMHPGMMHPGMMQQGMMHPGMMRQGMMHPGMMHQGMMLAPRLGWPLAVPRALTADEVTEALERLLRQTNNPNIRLGVVEQAGDDTFRATVTTKDGSLVQTLSIDRFSGEMRQSD